MAETMSQRLVRLERAGRLLGLSFRASKFYSDGKWWWTFTEAADHAPLSGCDVIVLVGLMQDSADLSRARPEIVLIPWGEAASNAVGNPAWENDRRLHIYVQPGSHRWEKWLIHPAEITENLIDSWLIH